MIDPLLALAPRFEAALSAALGAEHAGADPALRRSDRADYQANVAMSLAKKLRRPPREVAEAIVAKLDVSGICERVEIAGAGFINLTLSPTWLAGALGEIAASDRLGVPVTSAPETVVIDYSAPNVAKEMHVGNIRSTILGDALARVHEFLGHRVVRQNHLGDWGTPFGMLIEHLVDSGASGSSELAIGDLNAFYQQARTKFDADEAFADRARRRVVLLQGGDEDTLALWRRLVDESKRYFARVYERLGVTLREADICGESFYNPMLAGIAEELERSGLAQISEGALCIFPPGFTGRESKPLPLILRKQDGGYGYATTDMAAVRHRVSTLGGTRLLYVVGAPQQQHLAMVFAAARLAGWVPDSVRIQHVAFGSILGPDKKMFKTRSGEAVRLMALLEEAVQRATAVVESRSAELEPAERAEVARKIGIGAVKHADLSTPKDYVFDWDQMLAFEGNTAPYLQYAHARIRSIFRRGEVAVLPGDAAKVTLGDPAERALALELATFGAAVSDVAETLQPHRLSGYLYGLATAFTSFYERCPVLKAEGDALRSSRLVLCDLTAKVLAKGLDLLGIEAPERM